jgi:chromosome segregation ATPase
MAFWSRRVFPPLLAAVCVTGAEAQDDTQRAMARAQAMLRQVSAEKTALQGQVGDLQNQVEALTRQLAESRREAAARQQGLARQLDGSAERLRQTEERLSADLRGARAAQSADRVKIAELEQKLTWQTENFSLCYDNNKKLYSINRELLGHYQNKGAMDALRQREPLTGVGRVEVEKLVQDYRYRLEDLLLPAREDGPGAVPLSDHTF